MSSGDTTHQPRHKRDWLAIALLGVLVVIFLVNYQQIAHRTRPGPGGEHFGDFRHFYYAARALLDHTDLYSSGTGGYLYPPLIAFLYTPVARLGYRSAALVMLAVNVLLDLAGILLAAKVFAVRLGTSQTTRLVCAAALLGTLLNLDKIHLELQMFQTNALMFFMFALSLWWLDRRPILAGIPLGFVFNIKYLSLALLPWLIVRRRWGTAASFVVSAIGFSLLPAVISGWGENLRNLQVAYGGLLHMVGVGNGVQQANVEDIAAWFSCSITSSMARVTRLGPSMGMAMGYSAMIGLLSLGVVAMIYRREKLPLILWPGRVAQQKQPWFGLMGLEFSALVVASLCFSPQTNTRHLLLALLVTIPASMLILSARRVPRWVVLVGILIEVAGFSLPRGDSSISGDKSPALLWLGVAGPCWCLLIAMLTLLSVGLMQVKRAAESET